MLHGDGSPQFFFLPKPNTFFKAAPLFFPVFPPKLSRPSEAGCTDGGRGLRVSKTGASLESRTGRFGPLEKTFDMSDEADLGGAADGMLP